MSLKHSLAITTILGFLATMAACQASFQAGAGSSTTPNANPGAAGAPAAVAALSTDAAAAGSPGQAAASVGDNASPAPSKVKLKGGVIAVQSGLTFDSGKAILLTSPENEANLSDLKLFLDQSPKVTQMRIEAHTDNAGNAEVNLELSGQRALTIKKALIDKGIARERLLAVGFGDKKPIKDNATVEGRAQNQRVEFRVATWNGKNYLNQEPNGGGKVFE